MEYNPYKNFDLLLTCSIIYNVTMRFAIKVIITALIVVGVSELAKKIPLFAAIIASLPLTSILALTWLYWDTSDTSEVEKLSLSIFWAVLPSLLFFLALPFLLKKGLSYWSSLAISCAVMSASYFVYAKLMKIS